LNRVILLGNLARDIELTYISDKALSKTSIAVNKKYKNKQGEIVEDTMFIDLVFWGRIAEVANQYLKKGSKILVEGSLGLDRWTTADGTRRSKHVINVEKMEMLGCRGQGSTQLPPSAPYTSHIGSGNGKAIPATVPEIDVDDDDIPF